VLGLNTAWFEDIKKLSQLKALYRKASTREVVCSDNPESVLGGRERNREIARGRDTLEMIEEEVTKVTEKHFPSSCKPMVKISYDADMFHPKWHHDSFRPDESGFEGDSLDDSKILNIGPGKRRGR